MRGAAGFGAAVLGIALVSVVGPISLVQASLTRIDAKRVAQISGLVFIPAGLVKFAFHHWELHAFQSFGIPAASVMEPVVGVLEALGGVLLLMGTLLVPTACVLAVIMLVAFVAGGIIHASPIPSDTLAPALLAAMIYLIRTERHSPKRHPSLTAKRRRARRRRRAAEPIASPAPGTRPDVARRQDGPGLEP